MRREGCRTRYDALERKPLIALEKQHGRQRSRSGRRRRMREVPATSQARKAEVVCGLRGRRRRRRQPQRSARFGSSSDRTTFEGAADYGVSRLPRCGSIVLCERRSGASMLSGNSRNAAMEDAPCASRAQRLSTPRKLYTLSQRIGPGPRSVARPVRVTSNATRITCRRHPALRSRCAVVSVAAWRATLPAPRSAFSGTSLRLLRRPAFAAGRHSAWNLPSRSPKAPREFLGAGQQHRG
jgi:hypothetical protein